MTNEDHSTIEDKLEQIDRLLDEVESQVGPATGEASSTAIDVDVVVVLDRSGSMESLGRQPLNSFREMIGTQRATRAGRCRVTLNQFDHEFETVFDCVDLNDPRLTEWAAYVPRGRTALYDAIGRSFAAARPGEGTRGVMVVITDGMENASREFNARMLSALIRDKRAEGWELFFMCTTEEAMLQAGQVGIDRDAALLHDPSKEKYAGSWKRFSDKLAGYRSSGDPADLKVSDDDRRAVE